MKDEFRITTLSRNGKCIGCGREIKYNDEKIVRFSAHKSQVYGCTLCFDCIKELSKLVETENK